jgi:hypothetical protein
MDTRQNTCAGFSTGMSFWVIGFLADGTDPRILNSGAAAGFIMRRSRVNTEVFFSARDIWEEKDE